MGGLSWRCIRFGLAAVLGVMALGSGAGAIRLLPWLFSPEVPWRVTVPFARALLAAAGEVSLMVGVPLGFVLAAVVSVRRGEWRALAALGVSPSRMARSVVLAALAMSGAMAALARHVEPGTGIPGRFANALVREGSRACGHGPRTSWVPLADVTWLCFPNGTARVVAPLPRAHDNVWFSAESLVFSDDLSSAVVKDLAVASRAASQSMRLQLRVGVARIRNLKAWGQPPMASPRARFVGMALAVPVLGVGLLWLVFRRRVASPLLGGGIAVALGLGLFRLLQSLDRSGASAWAYLVLPAGIALGVMLLQLGWAWIAGVTRRVRIRLQAV